MEASGVRAYYEGALSALRHIEDRQPTGRRFGAEADARWGAFHGDLTTADRIDLLIRDADAQWPGAFGSRTVFARQGVAEDESFGMGWEPLDPVDAEDMWRTGQGKALATDLRATLTAVAAGWGATVVGCSVGAVGPAEKLVVAGPGAIIAVLESFSKGRDLDWADQVIVVATPPAHRQLAALGAALLNVAVPTRLYAHTDVGGVVKGVVHRVIVSDDADGDDAVRARSIGGGQ